MDRSQQNKADNARALSGIRFRVDERSVLDHTGRWLPESEAVAVQVSQGPTHMSASGPAESVEVEYRLRRVGSA